jgi:acetyl-CoA acetyltransferase
MRKIYIAAYHQSKFGKLLDTTIPQIAQKAVLGVCEEIDIEPGMIDVGSIGATCNISLNQQGLLAGLLAEVEGLAGKPIESVENACASGGQAILSTVQKLQMGWGDVGMGNSLANHSVSFRTRLSGRVRFTHFPISLLKSCRSI